MRESRAHSEIRIREEAYGELIESAGVDVVLLTALARDDDAEWSPVIRTTDGRTDESLSERLRRTTRATITRLEALAVRTVILENPITAPEGFSPLGCLSSARRTNQCLVELPERTPSDALYAREATRSRLVWTASLNDIACPTAPLCQPLRGDIPVWRDRKHYTPALMLDHWRAVERTLVATGAFDGPA